MSHRDPAPVGRRASALAFSTALACVGVAPSVLAQPAPAPAAPAPAAPAPAAPAPAAPAPATPPRAPAAAPAPEPVELEETPEDEPPAPTPRPTPAPSPPAPGVGVLPLWPEPSADAQALERQEAARPKPAAGSEAGGEVYAEDWWSHARPILELHGYFRLRAQLFHRFGLGRLDPPEQAMWPRPADDFYSEITAGSAGAGREHGAELCTDEEVDAGPDDSAASARNACDKGMQAGANIRFRLNPELHISDNLRVMSQIDLLDNLVLGSTPGGYSNRPSASGGYAVNPRNGYAPIGFFDDTQVPPSSGRNALMDSIAVKRAWAEYASPVGELRFGRMPFHWGLGMMFNAGDGHDDDYQSTVDRIQAVTGIKPLDLYFSAAWDFPNEGISSDAVALPNPEPYDLANLDDVDQYTFSIVRKKAPELERLSLARGELVLNGGLQVVYRAQTIADDHTVDYGTPTSGECTGSPSLNCPPGSVNEDTLSYVRREAQALIPDLWLELLYKKFRFGAELATVQGSIAHVQASGDISAEDPGYDIQAWGLATEIEQKLVEDKLQLGFRFGWASGDADEASLIPSTSSASGQFGQLGDRTFETFRFHPTYRVDMILHRHILTRVQGTYYFRPNVDYDFLRDASGQRIGGGIAAIWSRASQFIQAPGHERDLGIELNGRVYYQAKDGALNDLPGFLGGFYTEIDYGVLFPMGGLGYPDLQAANLVEQRANPEAADIRIAQTLRWYLGVLF